MKLQSLIAIVLAATTTPAIGGKLYRWVDERGVAHYADRPPAHQNFEQIEFKDDKSDSEPNTAPEDAKTAPEAGQASSISAEEARLQNCQNSRSVLAQLEANENVRMDTNGDGVLEQLSPAQRREQIALYRKRVGEYCGG
ncbi:MAG: hypothetical protein KatS3mg125_0777 [Lysobacterales bacterium]|jgi:hypothetical protein|nr:MAG: hypothetical protein KatS3mg125_0777 [Xanthomonadales bacterium]